MSQLTLHSGGGVASWLSASAQPPVPTDATPWIPRAKCLRRMGDALADAAHCGDKAVMKTCFGEAPDKLPEGYLRDCVEKAGCSGTDRISMEEMWMTVICIRTFGYDWAPLKHPDEKDDEKDDDAQLGDGELKMKRDEIVARHRK